MWFISYFKLNPLKKAHQSISELLYNLIRSSPFSRIPQHLEWAEGTEERHDLCFFSSSMLNKDNIKMNKKWNTSFKIKGSAVGIRQETPNTVGGGNINRLSIIISVDRACISTPRIHCSEPIAPGQLPQFFIWLNRSALFFTKKDHILKNKQKTSRNLTLLFYFIYFLTST